jgi:hypothetical protein
MDEVNDVWESDSWYKDDIYFTMLKFLKSAYQQKPDVILTYGSLKGVVEKECKILLGTADMRELLRQVMPEFYNGFRNVYLHEHPNGLFWFDERLVPIEGTSTSLWSPSDPDIVEAIQAEIKATRIRERREQRLIEAARFDHRNRIFNELEEEDYWQEV